MTLPANLILAKNAIDCKYPWLLLLKFALYEGESNEIIHRFVRNFKDVTFEGNLFKGFNFQIGLIEESSEGKIPTTSIAVCGVTQYLQPILEEYDGLVDAQVTITIVHADLLAEDYAELELEFDVIAPHITANVVSFQLGGPSPLRQRYPLNSYFTDLCPLVFKSARCGYSGGGACPGHRFSDCRALGNSARFGGTPGMG